MSNFSNMAGRTGIDSALEAELSAAGITINNMGMLLRDRGEVRTGVIGTLHGWLFERAWVYWRAQGPGLPPAYADPLHKTHGREVRVEGHCGCPSPLERYQGFGVSNYHVDTPEGLKALADALKLCVEDAARRQAT